MNVTRNDEMTALYEARGGDVSEEAGLTEQGLSRLREVAVTKFISHEKSPKGRWKPGQSGNPGGRAKVVAEVRDLARVHTREAIETLLEIMRDETRSEHARIAAARELLSRGWGHPPGHEWMMQLNLNVDSRQQSAVVQQITLSRESEAVLEDARRLLDGGELEVIDALAEDVPALPAPAEPVAETALGLAREAKRKVSRAGAECEIGP